MKNIPERTLRTIQRNFHDVIRSRAGELIDQHGIALPDLTPLLAMGETAWLDITGMYGGFEYWLEGEGEEAKLVCNSWSRVVDGSGQKHEVTATGSRLVEEGFA